MRGHVMLRLGRFHEGEVVLERARRQACNLDFTTNAHAIEISIHIHRATLGGFTDAVTSLDALLGREAAQDSYSRRSVLLELATRLAWLGQQSRASTLLAAAAPLCAGDARAEAALLCARANRARVSTGWPDARALAKRAAAVLPPGLDPSREVEILAAVWGIRTYRHAAPAGSSVAAGRAALVPRGTVTSVRGKLRSRDGGSG